MLKIITTAILCCSFFLCAAQKQLISYEDLQYVIQNKPTQITIYLKDKDFQLLPGSDANQLHFLGLIADQDYTDLAFNFERKHTKIQLTTTNGSQVALIQKVLQNYNGKNSKGSTKYHIKDGAIATITIKENELQVNNFKVYTIDLEN